MNPIHKKTSISIRALTLDDVSKFVDHLDRVLQSSGVDDTPIFTVRSRNQPMNIDETLEKTRSSWSKDIKILGWERAWGAFHEDSIIGAAGLSTARNIDTQMHRAMLGIGVESGFRKLGIGESLLHKSIEWAKIQPYLKWIDLGVFAHNHSARRLYEKFGFIECGRIPDCFRIDGHSVNDIQMVLDLQP